MSEFHVEVVEVGLVEKHPNADTLGITHVHAYPVIVRLDEFKPGDKAVYIPVDSVVPADDPRWAWLDGHCRIKAKRLRGVFSMGLLTKADPSWSVGQNVVEELRITKYEPPEPMSTSGEDESPPPGAPPMYTDIEGLRRYPDILREGEMVAITEKLHGANLRAFMFENALHMGSHRNWKRRVPENPLQVKTPIWWLLAERMKLESKLREFPQYAHIAWYGEVYGQVQDLRYGTSKGELCLAVFDALDLRTRAYLDWEDYERIREEIGLPRVPLLYVGPWKPDLVKLAEGPTTVPGADHVREGIVIRPLKEHFDDRVGRVVVKYHGEGYLTRKGG